MTELRPVGQHECVTCANCGCTFAAGVHLACPRCQMAAEKDAALQRMRVAVENDLGDAFRRGVEAAEQLSP